MLREACEVVTDVLVAEGALTADILRPAFLRKYEKVVETGAGVCSRCDCEGESLSAMREDRRGEAILKSVERFERRRMMEEACHKRNIHQ